jgi:4-hydroxy-tetrahydrodipicolinate reductase
MQTLILGDGHLGRAIATTLADRADPAVLVGRPPGRHHGAELFSGSDLVIDASRGDAVAANVAGALDGGVRRFVIAATAWTTSRDQVDEMLRARGASAVIAANFSLGVALFARLVETATDLFGSIEGYEPFIVEWHRRGKSDRPSGTAIELARRIVERHPGLTAPGDLETVSVRAGSSPGMHLVGFDAAGESVELRVTARDRGAYVTGVLAATDWLRRAPRAPGIHAFDAVIDELLDRRPAAA